MLNLSQYQRERAKANLALIEAAGSAASGSSSGFAIPGLGGGGAASAANPNIAPLVSNLSQNNPVSPGRLLTPSQLQPNGGVAVRLAEAIKHPGGREDFLLKDGDTIVVPETPNHCSGRRRGVQCARRLVPARPVHRLLHPACRGLHAGRGERPHRGHSCRRRLDPPPARPGRSSRVT